MSKTIKKRTLSDVTSSSNDSDFLYNVQPSKGKEDQITLDKEERQMVKLNKQLRNDILVETHKKRYDEVGLFKGKQAKLLNKPVGAYSEDFELPHRRQVIASTRTQNLSPINENGYGLAIVTETVKKP
jgi:hypothetical protein